MRRGVAPRAAAFAAAAGAAAAERRCVEYAPGGATLGLNLPGSGAR
eukprot:gene19227-45113_t